MKFFCRIRSRFSPTLAGTIAPGNVFILQIILALNILVRLATKAKLNSPGRFWDKERRRFQKNLFRCEQNNHLRQKYFCFAFNNEDEGNTWFFQSRVPSYKSGACGSDMWSGCIGVCSYSLDSFKSSKESLRKNRGQKRYLMFFSTCGLQYVFLSAVEVFIAVGTFSNVKVFNCRSMTIQNRLATNS